MSATRLFQRAALILFGVSLCFLLMEISARVYARVARQDRVLVYDSLLGWKPIPGARKHYTSEEQPYTIEINSKGLRDRERSYDKSPGVFRILVLGDSFVFGSGGVEQAHRFTELMESSVPNLEVINAGVPGYSTDQEFLYLQSEGLRYHPDLVVVCIFLNDLRESFLSFNPSIGRPKGYITLEGSAVRFYPPSLGLFYRAFQSSYLLGGLDQRLHLFERFAPPLSTEVALDREQQRQAFSLLLVETRDLCRAHAVEFVAVYFPFKSQKERHIIQEVLSDLAAREQLPVLDFMGILRPKDDPETSFFVHDVHLNDRGHVLVARELLRFLSRNTSLGRRLPVSAAP